MSKPILVITRRLPPAVEARAGRDYDARLNASDAPVTGADVLARADGAAAILCCPAERLDAATIAALPASVRVLGTFSVGHDHIDLPAARARGLPVVNTPDVLSVATAECAMLLILAAARRAGEGERLVRSGGWTGWTPTQLLGTQVSGRRLGILGMGRIGRELALIQPHFGQHSGHPFRSFAQRWGGGLREGREGRVTKAGRRRIFVRPAHAERGRSE